MKITAPVGVLCDRLLQDSENHLENDLPCENMGGFLYAFWKEHHIHYGTALGSACVFFMKKQLGDKPRYKEIIEKLPHLKKETDKKSNRLIVVDKGFM